MTREVRANLFFIVALVLLITPGFVFLMKKKLSDTSGHSNFMPEAAPYQIAYIQPLPVPPVPRKEPRAAREWIDALIKSHVPQSSDVFDYIRSSRTDTPPMVSDRFLTQLVAIDGTGSPHRVSIVRWDETDLPAQRPAVAVDFKTGSVAAAVEKLEPIDVPKDVRHALQDVGYVDPPQRVWWIEATFDPAALRQNTIEAVRLTTHASGSDVQEVIALHPAATRPFIEVLP